MKRNTIIATLSLSLIALSCTNIPFETEIPTGESIKRESLATYADVRSYVLTLNDVQAYVNITEPVTKDPI